MKVNEIFITGSGRSGTTALREVFALHKDIFSFRHELNYFVIPGGIDYYLRGLIDEKILENNLFYNDIFGSSFSLKENWFDRIIISLKDNGIFIDKDYLKKDFRELFDLYINNESKDRMNKVSNFLNGMYDIIRKLTRKSIILEKTPENMRMADKIAEIFPDSMNLNIIRDPFDVIASKRKQRWHYNKSIEELILTYEDVMKASFHHWGKTPKKNRMVIRFEDLIANKRDHITDILKKINVESYDEFQKKIDGILLKDEAHAGRAVVELSNSERDLIKKHCFPIYRKWIGRGKK